MTNEVKIDKETELRMKDTLSKWMKEAKDPITSKLVETIGGMQLLKEKYGNVTLDEAMEKTSRIVLTRLFAENSDNKTL